MTKITVTNDPTLYLRNSGLRGMTYNMLTESFTTGKNKEHYRPLSTVFKSTKKVKE